VSRPITSRSMWLLRIRAKARWVRIIWASPQRTGTRTRRWRSPASRTIFPTATSPTRSVWWRITRPRT